MNCLEPLDKKTFGIDVYRSLNETFGKKRYYEISEIEEVIKSLEYPNAYACWAFVAFMLPANAGEYFRAKGTPKDVLEMKRAFILAMTDGERNSLNLPKGVKSMYDIDVPELTQMNLVNLVAIYYGMEIGSGIVHSMMGR